MVTTLRRIDPVSLAKIYGAVYAIIFLLFALPVGCMMSMMGGMAGAFGDTGGLGAGFGLVAIVLYPIFGAIVGFIGGLVTAVVYNFVADRVGGVEIELDGYGGQPDIL